MLGDIINRRKEFLELIGLKCTSQILTRVVFFLTLVLCCWTHPNYYESRIARLFRAPLAIISSTWWLCYPVVFAVRPLETNVGTNLGHYAVCYILLWKSLDWGFFSGPQSRRKFVQSRSNPLSGSWQVTENKGTATLDKLNALLGHLLFQFTSLRGLQYPWGHFSQINRNSFKVDLLRFAIFQTYSLIVTGISVTRERAGSRSIQAESGTFATALNFIPFISVLEQWKNTLMLVTGLCATFEALQSYLAVLAHCLHPLLTYLGFPDLICEFFDPIYYPPLFGNLREINSLAEFWGKTWHQVFRRSFIVLGAFPLAGIAIALGFSSKHQRTLGFAGAFIASGFLHAYPFFLMSDATTTTGRISNGEKLSVFFCFFSQALGSLIEEKVIPLIPKRLGGGKLWTIGFLLISLPFFSNSVTEPGRLLTIFHPVEEWGFFHLITPVIIAPIFL